ncbi:MAG: hypothetical protein EXR71_09375 [Myxococcales bacterium]|nr:hypothetical protein [Myxococcales bacterium]
MFAAFLVTQALALPLLVERFDSAPVGWKERVASQAGGGPSSKYVVADGVITFTATPHTKKFLSLGKRVDLRGVEWVEVTAKLTAVGVEGAAPGAICGVFLRFDTGQVVATRECAPRQDRAPHRRHIAVPSGARDMEVGVWLGAAGTLTVDDIVVESAPPDLKSLGRGRFQYHWVGNDGFREEQLEANDARFAELAAFFGVPATLRLDYWKYADAATMENFTGDMRSYIATDAAVHTLLRTDVRAMMASLSRGWGNPGPLFFEGLAVHLAGDWEGRDPRLSTRQAVNAGTASTLAALLEPARFAAEPPARAYTYAGALVSWLVATRGPETVKACFGAVSASATVAANVAALEKALGAPLSKVEADFRASL